MTDVFGNYVIQKFLEHGSEEQRSQLLLKVIIRSISVATFVQFFSTSGPAARGVPDCADVRLQGRAEGAGDSWQGRTETDHPSKHV